MKRKLFFHAFYESRHCKRAMISLAFCWSLGLALGFSYGKNADPFYFRLMRMASFEHTSIIGLLIVLFLPLLFSAVAVYHARPQILLPVCFIKAFLMASCSVAIAAEFGSSGWLVRFLLQFSDCCFSPFLFWFCIRNVSSQRESAESDFLLCSIALLIVGILDRFVISPFLVRLIDI